MPNSILRLAAAGLTTKRRKNRTARPVRPSRANELWYKAHLRELVARLRAATEAAILPILKAEATTVDASIEQQINAQLEQMARQFGGIDALAKRLADEAVNKNLQAVDTSLAKNMKSAIGIDIRGLMHNDDKIATKMRAANEANVALIKSIPEQYFDKIRALVSDNTEGGFRYEDIADQVKSIGDVTDSRADLIARDQTSKMNGAFNEARQTSLGISKYRWQGADDERERDTHVANNDQIFDWDDPPPETGHPGEDIQCRCVAIPVFDLG